MKQFIVNGVIKGYLSSNILNCMGGKGLKHTQKDVKSKKFFRKTDYADYWTEKIRTRKYEEGYTDYFIDLMKVEKRHGILEIGAGEGRFIPKLVNKGAIYFGIDISDRILKRAKEHIQTHNKSNINLIVADAENLPFHESFRLCVLLCHDLLSS